MENLKIKQAIRQGWAGIDSSGVIVDRRKVSNAKPLDENQSLGIGEPKHKLYFNEYLTDGTCLNTELGARVKSFRKFYGNSQMYLANRLGLSRTSIVNIEKGKHQITFKVLKKLCEFYDIKSSDFLPF